MKKNNQQFNTMLPNRVNCGLGKYNPPLFPLVKDDKGEIVAIDGTRYSRKRQHYPR